MSVTLAYSINSYHLQFKRINW